MKKNVIMLAGSLIMITGLVVVSLTLIGCERETELPIPPFTVTTSPVLEFITTTTIAIFPTTTTTTLPQVAAPRFCTPPGTYEANGLIVRVDCPTEGADIFYSQYVYGAMSAAGSANRVAAAATGTPTMEISINSASHLMIWAEKDGYRKSDHVMGDFDLWWWNTLSEGFNNQMNAIAQYGLVFYGGGMFTAPYEYVAKSTGLGIESVPGAGGPDDQVYALACDSVGNLYSGGKFTNYLLMNDGSTWSTVGGGGLDHRVYALLFDSSSGNLYVGGQFTSAGGVPVNRVAKWDGSTWEALGGGIDNGSVRALALGCSGELYVGGDFTSVSGVADTARIARWNSVGATWEAVGKGISNGRVHAIVADEVQYLYVGGTFSSVNGVAGTAGVARWHGPSAAWESVGGGSDGTVYTLDWGDNGQLYAGGAFSMMGGQFIYDVARWDPSTLTWVAAPGWSPGYYSVGEVYDIHYFEGGYVVVAGNFVKIDGAQGNHLAIWGRYDGTIK